MARRWSSRSSEPRPNPQFRDPPTWFGENTPVSSPVEWVGQEGRPSGLAHSARRVRGQARRLEYPESGRHRTWGPCRAPVTAREDRRPEEGGPAETPTGEDTYLGGNAQERAPGPTVPRPRGFIESRTEPAQVPECFHALSQASSPGPRLRRPRRSRRRRVRCGRGLGGR